MTKGWHNHSVEHSIAARKRRLNLRHLLDTPEKLKSNQKYWDGYSWIRKGFSRDAHGVIIEDKKWKTKLNQLRGFVKEEKQTAKLYKKLGYPAQGKDEAGHARFFKKEIKKAA
jgi:hypothetical protein